MHFAHFSSYNKIRLSLIHKNQFKAHFIDELNLKEVLISSASELGVPS